MGADAAVPRATRSHARRIGAVAAHIVSVEPSAAAAAFGAPPFMTDLALQPAPIEALVCTREHPAPDAPLRQKHAPLTQMPRPEQPCGQATSSEQSLPV